MQDILTYSFVIFAFGYTFYHAIRMFLPKEKSLSDCGDGCGSCEIKKDIVHQYKLKNINLEKKK